jgi:hypothetical protein
MEEMSQLARIADADGMRPLVSVPAQEIHEHGCAVQAEAEDDPVVLWFAKPNSRVFGEVNARIRPRGRPRRTSDPAWPRRGTRKHAAAGEWPG